MLDPATNTSYIAILGWSLRAIEALDKFNRKFVVVAPPWAEDYARENGINYIKWDFERLNETATGLYEQLKEAGVDVAVPLYEETVEWAGAVNSRLQDDPRLFMQSLLFRDKAMMKRRAQISGLRVGVFEEAWNHDDVRRFLKRVNDALLKVGGEPNDPIHLKPFDRAGCSGHRVISSDDDVGVIKDDEFPCLLESHLDGKEFACEVFIHDKKIRFLNISEYVHLGYSVFVPPGPQLEGKRERIRAACEQLIEAFDIRYGVIHPEWFITKDDVLHFGEVAYRVPGGNAFELIERAYGFNAYQGHVLCSDPKATEAEIRAFFPPEDSADGYAGCLLVYPNVRYIEDLDIPDELTSDPYYEKHDLFLPVERKVAERVGFGTHYGNIFFHGAESRRMKQLLLQWEKHEFYV
jgi:hypothetical protein